MIYRVEYSKAADRTLRKWIYDDRVTVLIIQAEEHYNDK